MWRRSASTAATRISAETRDVWRQLRQTFRVRDVLPHRRAPRSRQRHLRQKTIMTLDSHAIKQDARRGNGAQLTMQ
jgi:hypothetical protein